MNKLIAVYSSGFCLLRLSLLHPVSFYNKSKTTSWSWFERISDPLLEALAKAIFLGQKSGIPREALSAYADLNLQHLFTPSGIHLSSLLFPLLLLKKKRWERYLLPPLYLALFISGQYYSMQRICLFRMGSTFLKLSTWQAFLFAFGVDFLLGSYRLSPMSYSYSFLFLGTLLASREFPKIYLPFLLFGAQLIAANVLAEEIYITNILSSFFLTSLFSLLYPLLVFLFLLPTTLPLLGFKFLLSGFHSLVMMAHEYSSLLFYFPTTLFLLSLLPIKSKRKKLLFMGFLLFQSPHLNKRKAYAGFSAKSQFLSSHPNSLDLKRKARMKCKVKYEKIPIRINCRIKRF